MNRLDVGDQIEGKYEVLQRIGGGGMGEVYRVRHLHLDEVRVIKVLRSDLARSQAAADRFQQEARLATQVKHPRVATLHDFSQLADGSFYMVWESIEGQDVDSWLREKGIFPIAIALELGIQALSGLEAIHRAQIVHRDISPDNLMITTDGRGRIGVKIIDLGLADDLRNVMGDEEDASLIGGKLNYCSPEHVGYIEGVRPDHLSDLYSFGLVLYRMVSGCLPFERVKEASSLRSRFESEPQRASILEPEADVSPELDELLLRSVAVDREQRFQSATELREALQSLSEAPRRRVVGPSSVLAEQVEVAATALRDRRIDEAEALIEDLEASGVPEAEALRAQLQQLRAAQRQVQLLQLREMVDQYVLAGQGALARMALGSVLEIDPDYRDRASLEEKIEALSERTEKRRQAQEALQGARRMIEQNDLEGARAVADRFSEVLPELAQKVVQEAEAVKRERKLEDEVSRRRERIHELLERRELDAVEDELSALVELGVPKVTIDVHRSQLARLRDEMARAAKADLIRRSYPEAIAKGQWDVARQLAFDLQRESPADPSAGQMIAEVDRLEAEDSRRKSIEEGAATVTALIDGGRMDDARIALQVLRRMAPDHPLVRYCERRLGQASDSVN